MLFKVEMAKEKKKVFLRTIFIILLFSVFLLLVLWLLVRDTVMILIFFVAVAYIYLIYLCEFKIEVYEDFFVYHGFKRRLIKIEEINKIEKIVYKQRVFYHIYYGKRYVTMREYDNYDLLLELILERNNIGILEQ